MNNLSKKLLESFDSLDSCILCERTHLTEARDSIHVTVINGDMNEDFIKANRKKIVDVYTNGPEGFFFTKGIPSGRFEYDDEDGYLTGECGLDPDKLFLKDGSINKDYIVSELGLTKWDGTYYSADGSTKHFSWGDTSGEDKRAREARRDARAKEKSEKELDKRFLVDLSDKIKTFAEDKLGVELEYSIAHGYPVYSKKGVKSRLFRVYVPSYDKSKLADNYDGVLNKAYEEAVYKLIHEDYEFRAAFDKKADKDIKKGGSVSNRVDFNGEAVKLEEVIRAIPSSATGGELLKDPGKKITITVDPSEAEQSFKQDSVYKLTVKSDVQESDISDEYKWVAEEAIEDFVVYVGPYSHSFGTSVISGTKGGNCPIVSDAVIEALKAYGLKHGNPQYHERDTIGYMKKTGQLK